MQSGSLRARAYWMLWVGGAVIVAFVTWWLWPDTSSTKDTARRDRMSSPTETSDAMEPVAGPSRVLEVMVEGCRGPAADTLVFVKVGDHLVSGTTDPRGKARIATAVGPAEVRARVAGWEGTAWAGAVDTSVVVRSCRSGEVTGRVWHLDDGEAARGVVVRLVDAAGVQLDEAITDEQGDYRLIDAELTAGAIEIVDEDDHALVETVLEPLRPGEVREVNLVIGNTFELVGWVLDVRGEPLAGVLVSIGSESTGMSWRTVTDAGGAFQFLRAPVLPLILTAHGGDLGIVTRRVLAENERRIDVTLVLEPTGAVVVLAPPEVKGRVVLTSWTTAVISSPVDNPYGDTEPIVFDEDDSASEETTEAQVELLQRGLTEALKEYDETDPVGGIADTLIHLHGMFPELGSQIRAELNSQVPGAEDMRFEALARIAAERVIAEDPKTPQIMAIAAEKARSGINGLDAFMTATQEVEINQQLESPEMTPELAAEAEAVDPGAIELVVDTESPLYKRLMEQWGDAIFAYFPEEATPAAQGALGEVIQVPGALRYYVTIVFDETDPGGQRYALQCGEVLVPAGRTIEIYCGRETEAIITGTVVDVRGQPLEGAKVVLQDENETMTDRDGTYTITWSGSMAVPCSLRVVREVGGEAWRPSERVNLQCAPGSTLEVAPITLRREDEAPVHHPETPFGGVGGALENGSEGVQISYVSPDGPLALDGIDEHSTILRVDDEDATSWPVEEMLTRLRGDVGSHVQLQVRGPDGELIETVIERSLITP